MMVNLLGSVVMILHLISPPWILAQDDPTEHIQHAAALIAQGELEAAEKVVRAALSNSSTRPLAYASLGAIRMRQRKLEESSQFFEKAIGLNPNLLGARVTLGQVYALQGRTELARKTFQEAY